jgi:hypothetical protein
VVTPPATRLRLDTLWVGASALGLLDTLTADAMGVQVLLEALDAGDLPMVNRALGNEVDRLMVAPNGANNSPLEDFPPDRFLIAVWSQGGTHPIHAANLRTLTKAGSPTRRELDTALADVSEAATAIRSLADFLERNPEPIIQGRSKRSAPEKQVEPVSETPASK